MNLESSENKSDDAIPFSQCLSDLCLLSPYAPSIIVHHLNTSSHEAVQEFLDAMKEYLEGLNKHIKDLRDDYGKNILHYAVGLGNRDLVEVIVNKFPRILYTKDNAEQTVLMFAAHMRNPAMVKKIIALAGKSSHTLADIKNMNGSTALTIAADTGCVSCFTLIANIEGKRKPTWIFVRNKQGHTPLHLAARNGHSAIVQNFISRYLNTIDRPYILSEDQNGMTAIDLAKNSDTLCHRAIVELLEAAIRQESFKDDTSDESNCLCFLCFY